MNKKFIIIDGNALVHRAFHALPILTTKSGKIINAAYGFTLVFLKMLKELKPDYLICTFDTPAPTFRHNEYKEYKATRVKAPQELYDQIPMIKKILEGFNVPIYEKSGFEADDLIGSISEKISSDEKLNKYIETIIVTGDLDTLQLINKNTKIYTLKKGIKDTVIYDKDKVIERYGLVPEQMVDFKGLRGDPSDNIPGVPGIGEKTASKLLKEFSTIEKLYEIIEKENPESIKPRMKELLLQWKNQAFFSKKLATIKTDIPLDIDLEKCALENFDREETKKLFKDLEFYSLVEKIPYPSAPPLHKGGLREVNKENNLQTLQLSKKNPSSLNSLKTSSAGRFEPSLKSKTNYTKGQSEGFDLPDNILINSKETKEKIEKLYQEKVFSEKIYEIEKNLISVIEKMEKIGVKIDIGHLKKLSADFAEKLKNLETEIHKLSGVEFNVNSPKELRKILFEKLEIPTKGLKKTPGGLISTSAPELLKIKDEHPIVSLIEKYREIAKLKSTYADALPALADSENNRIHTTFDQLGTTTGRISSSRPNLQNIPIRSKMGREIRKAFIAENGWSFIAADYSQIELRIIASLAKDKKMIKAFLNEEDIHKATASEIYQVPLEKVSKEERQSAKALNFGIIYGMSVFGFSQAAKIDNGRARQFIEDYMIKFKEVAGYIEAIKIKAKENGYTETLFGRKRHLPELYSSNRLAKNAAERAAINSPIQGTAADIIKMAMIEGDRQIDSDNARLLLQIHDELVFEVKKEKVSETAEIIKNIMENITKLEVPLKVDVSVGENLGELEKLG